MSEDKSPTSKWVQFEEEDKDKATTNGPEAPTGEASAPAVIAAETTHLPPPKTAAIPVEPKPEYSGAVISTQSVHLNPERPRAEANKNGNHEGKPEAQGGVTLRTVDLHENNSNGTRAPSGQTTTHRVAIPSTGNAVIRQGFANGDIIVTLLPCNTKWPWITPAKFRPELVPEELMAQGLTLTVEDYVHIMEILTNDVRFHIYNVCYKRILIVWIFTAFLVLLGLLFSGVTGLTLFGLGVLWLILNAGAIFLCMWIKIKLNHNLEKCLGQVNKHLIRHKIILGLDDRGKMSCHKVNLCFIYFDTTDCVKKLQEVIEREERDGRTINREETAAERRQRVQFQQRMDIDDNDIIIQGSHTTRLSRKQAKGEQVMLRYGQRWCKDHLRRRLDWTIDETGGNPPAPRHLISGLCLCQYIEQYLASKPKSSGFSGNNCWSSWFRERNIN